MATGLEVKPLVDVMNLIASSVRQGESLVILLDEVSKHDTGLPKNEIPVRILDNCLDTSLFGPKMMAQERTWYISGTQPLGLRLVKGGDLMAEKGITLISYGTPIPSRTKMT